MKDEKLNCNKCKCEDFNILRKHECCDCEYNGAWDNEGNGGYIHDKKIIKEKKLDRSQADMDGECDFQDYNYNNGCWIITCTSCKNGEHSIPCADS